MRLPVSVVSNLSGWRLNNDNETDALAAGIDIAAGGVTTKSAWWTVPLDERWFITRLVAWVADSAAVGGKPAQVSWCLGLPPSVLSSAQLQLLGSYVVHVASVPTDAPRQAVAVDLNRPLIAEPNSTITAVFTHADASLYDPANPPGARCVARLHRAVYKESNR